MQLISTALDKSIKYAMLGIGYGITIAGNAISQRGMKFNKQRGDRLADDGELDEKRADLQAQTDRLGNRRTATERQRDADVNKGITDPDDLINEGNLDDKETLLANTQTAIGNAATRIDDFRTNHQTELQGWKDYNDAVKARDEAATNITALNTEIANIESQIAAIEADATMRDVEKEARIKNLTENSLIPKKDKLAEQQQKHAK